MGVELRLFVQSTDDTDVKGPSHDIFSESLLNTENHNTTPERDAEYVHAELDEIKHADDGKGKVTVEVKKKKNRPKYNRERKTNLPPLFVYGDDDCSAVYELLVNTYGLSINLGPDQPRLNTATVKSSSDVPLIICRSLGPCMYTTLRTLSTSNRRDTGYANQLYTRASSKTVSQDNEQHHHSATNAKSFLELRGPVLPCAIRDLTCAMVDLMLMDKCKQDRSPSGHLQIADDQYYNTSTSSHQFSMFLQSHDGEYSISTPKSTGSSSSIYFNGSNLPLSSRDEDHCDARAEWFECNHGDFVNVLVWDISRKSVVTTLKA
eukprot:CAMPEP_0181131948 /NCGR_PEP_ID=MMETSP1071-20121207/30732_1 /TAXON_ID=35127 /ORGANISM="Thalassiosira sp., Strain NH16" /LENGTH=319 /DNA_ID=CAMNT_0023218245 /DNA_START=78 /DNA_END=1037 /DNA_ORIENTATION=+